LRFVTTLAWPFIGLIGWGIAITADDGAWQASRQMSTCSASPGAYQFLFRVMIIRNTGILSSNLDT
jgi:hypothetical protein